MNDHKNTIIAVILSGMVLIGWQYFFVVPQMEKQKQAQQAQQTQQAQQPQPVPQTPGAQGPGATVPQAGAAPTPSQLVAPAVLQTRDAAIAATPRIKIELPSLTGSIALKGARIDDLSLVQYRVTVDPRVRRSRCSRHRTALTDTSRNLPGIRAGQRFAFLTQTPNGSRKAAAR